MPPSDAPGAAVWRECKQRVAALAARVPNALAVDFMRPSPITSVDDNYWDGMHYRIAIADRIARDLGAADRGEASPDYVLLANDGRRQPSAERSASAMNTGTAAARSAHAHLLGRRVCLGDVAWSEHDAGRDRLQFGGVGAVWRGAGRLADQIGAQPHQRMVGRQFRREALARLAHRDVEAARPRRTPPGAPAQDRPWRSSGT